MIDYFYFLSIDIIMEKQLFFILVLSFLQSITAQEYEYIPTIRENTQWSYCDVWRIHVDKYDLRYSYIYFEGDTVINNIIYKKSCRYSCQSGDLYCATAMREEEKKYTLFLKNKKYCYMTIH